MTTTIIYYIILFSKTKVTIEHGIVFLFNAHEIVTTKWKIVHPKIPVI